MARGERTPPSIILVAGFLLASVIGVVLGYAGWIFGIGWLYWTGLGLAAPLILFLAIGLIVVFVTAPRQTSPPVDRLVVDRTENRPVDLHIRLATEADLPAVVDIYNQSIPAGWSTADTKPVAVAGRVEWFRKFDPDKRPIWVAELDGEVVGTAYLSSFYAGRPAYDATAEVSVYVATACHRRGVGRRLKEFVIGQCPRLGVTTLLSMHFDHNAATQHINDSLGFEKLGHLTEIAVVQGQKRGLIISGLRIPPAEGTA